MLGVLTVMVILAAVVTENVIERMKAAARDSERTSMNSITDSLRGQVLRSKSIPGTNAWANQVATTLSMAPNRVTVNSAGNNRVLLFDPAFRVGTNSTAVPPYTQTASGSLAPASPRVLILSSLAAPLPSIDGSAATFSNLWNTASNALPAGWAGNWSGRADDLLISRFDLGRMFRRVMLENLDVFQPAPYSVEATNTLTWIPAGQRREMWIIDTTSMNFHFNDGSLQAREFVCEDVSYTYEDGSWRRFLRYGRGGSVGAFGDMVDLFLNAPPPPGMTRRYSNQQWIVDAMYVFLYDFGQWSLDSFTGGSPWPHIPGYELSSVGASCLSNFSSDLLNYY